MIRQCLHAGDGAILTACWAVPFTDMINDTSSEAVKKALPGGPRRHREEACPLLIVISYDR